MRLRKTIRIGNGYRMKHFLHELPEHYSKITVIRFDDAPSGFIIDLKAVFPGILLTAFGYLWVKPDMRQLLLSLLFSAAAIYPYLCLHEIVHGVVYRIIGIPGIKIGFTKNGAYCSVPDYFLYRHVAVTSTAAPFVIFTLLFSAAGFRMIYSGNWLFLLFGMLLMLHLFACRSDVHLLQEFRKFKIPDLLIQDRGTAQSIYLPNK